MSGQPANLPKYIIVTINYLVVHEQVPSLDFVYGDNIHHFYGGPVGIKMSKNHIREMSPEEKEDAQSAKLDKIMKVMDTLIDAKETLDDAFDVKDLFNPFT